MFNVDIFVCYISIEKNKEETILRKMNKEKYWPYLKTHRLDGTLWACRLEISHSSHIRLQSQCKGLRKMEVTAK